MRSLLLDYLPFYPDQVELSKLMTALNKDNQRAQVPDNKVEQQTREQQKLPEATSAADDGRKAVSPVFLSSSIS